MIHIDRRYVKLWSRWQQHRQTHFLVIIWRLVQQCPPVPPFTHEHGSSLSTELAGPQVCPDLGSRGPQLQAYECDTTTHTQHMLRLHVPQATEPVPTCKAGVESSENCRVSLIARETLERKRRSRVFYPAHTSVGNTSRTGF